MYFGTVTILYHIYYTIYTYRKARKSKRCVYVLIKRKERKPWVRFTFFLARPEIASDLKEIHFLTEMRIAYAQVSKLPRLRLASELNSKTRGVFEGGSNRQGTIKSKTTLLGGFTFYGAPHLTSVEHLCKTSEKPYGIRV